MLFFNNLVVNLFHSEFTPFLFNLLSFRRRLLNEQEFALMMSMAKKDQINSYSNAERTFYEQLVFERQIIDTQTISQVNTMLSHEYQQRHIEFYDSLNLDIGIQITQNCNMNCAYCYEKKYLFEKKTISRAMIDNIEMFYEAASLKTGKTFTVAKVRITGGEPLFSNETVDLINYCAAKWPNAIFNIQTNGLNLLKYYDILPLSQIGTMSISLDGERDVHMARRFSGSFDPSLYDTIISGIKRLLNDNRKVALSTVIDKSNYMYYKTFRDYLRKENILSHPCFRQVKGLVSDLTNDSGLDPAFNTKEEAKMIADFLSTQNGSNIVSLTPDMSTFVKLLHRDINKIEKPSLYRCKAIFFNNHFFSANGNVYVCDCIRADKGIIGTYYPAVAVDFEAVNKLACSNPVVCDDKCIACPYKYLCLGGCPMARLAMGKERVCGSFGDESYMDDICCDPSWARIENNMSCF